MNLITSAIFGILFSTVSAQASVVYKCVDGTRSFTVGRSANGEYRGYFKDFTGAPEAYRCERTGRGYKFKCTRGEYIVTVRRGASGAMMVDFELAGDFFPESGYLYALTCE